MKRTKHKFGSFEIDHLILYGTQPLLNQLRHVIKYFVKAFDINGKWMQKLAHRWQWKAVLFKWTVWKISSCFFFFFRNHCNDPPVKPSPVANLQNTQVNWFTYFISKLVLNSLELKKRDKTKIDKKYLKSFNTLWATFCLHLTLFQRVGGSWGSF